jgi:hypothetical protein
MDTRIILLLIAQIAGLVMVVGGMWLIYKEKICIDKESKEPIEVSLPGNFSFKSNYPALALFALGFIPLIYPFHEFSNLSEYPHVVRVDLTGVPDVNVHPAVVYAAVSPPYAVTQDGDSFTVQVPFIGSGHQEYKVLLVANEHVLDVETAKKTGKGAITVNFKKTVVEPSEYRITEAAVPPGYK